MPATARVAVGLARTRNDACVLSFGVVRGLTIPYVAFRFPDAIPGASIGVYAQHEEALRMIEEVNKRRPSPKY